METALNRENHATVLTIGLTGGIGSGKSEASGILRELGALVIDADIVGHETYRSGQPAWDEMQRVSRSVAGIRTDSTSSPSASLQRCLTVPSEERDTVSATASSSAKALMRAERSSKPSATRSSTQMERSIEECSGKSCSMTPGA